jgi:hypothetical protein
VTPPATAPALHTLWLAGLPEATEQDEVVPCHHAVFHVADVPALEAALAAHPDLDDADGRYVWRPRGGGEVEPAAFDLEDDELVVHAPSPELAREARELIEAAAGPAVRYLGDLDDDEPDGDGAEDDEAADGEGPREVAVDWGELEQAFAGSGDEVGAYLDMRTGRVVRVPAQGGGNELSGEALDDGLARGRLLPVAPASSDDEYGWMEEFAASVAEGGLRRRLTAALEAAEPFGRFAAALRTHPAEHERWLALRGARMRALIQQWLADQGIVPTTAPPAR